MKGTVFAALNLAIALAAAMPFEVIEDSEGEQYYLVPLQRERRGTTTWDVRGPDLTGIVKHEGAIINTDDIHLDGSAYAAKDLSNLKNLRPEQYGADLRLSHLSGVAATLAADHQRGGPTDVTAGLNYNLFQDKNVKFDLAAEYARQFGGPQGAGRPDAGIFLRGEARY